MTNKSDFLEKLIGKQVYINGNGKKRKGPDVVSGTLLYVKKDFLAVLTETGPKYIQRNHIKTIFNSFTKSYDNTANPILDNLHQYEVYEADSFIELLRKARYKYSTISSGGPNKVKGIIESVDDNSVNVVTENAYVQIPLYHVRSLEFSLHEKNKDSDHDHDDKKDDKKKK